MGNRRPADAREWMELQVATMFRSDARGRLVAVDERGPRSAPVVFLGRTLAGNVARVRADVPEPLASEVERVLASEPLPAALDGTAPACEPRVRELIADLSPAPTCYHGPAFHFTEPPVAPDTVVPATARNLAEMFEDEAARLSDFEPCVVRIAEGRTVARCCSSAIGPDACEAGLETIATARRRGFAGEVVRGWASAVFASGREPLYSTTWENTPSRRIAGGLGLVCYGEDWHLT